MNANLKIANARAALASMEADRVAANAEQGAAAWERLIAPGAGPFPSATLPSVSLEMPHKQPFFAEMDQHFADWIQRATDLKGVMNELLGGAIGSLTDAVMKSLTERDHRGAFKDAGRQIFTGVARSGLEGAEGMLMKGLGLGKLGSTQSNAMWVRMAGIGASVGAAAGAVGSAMGTSAGGFVNFLGSVGKFFGFMDSGGLMQPGGYYLTGERGPELMRVGATSRIAGSRDTKALLSGGGGGGVTNHHTWNIDARGANDPAAVQVAVQRAIQSAAPHIISASMMAMDERQARRPNLR